MTVAVAVVEAVGMVVSLVVDKEALLEVHLLEIWVGGVVTMAAKAGFLATAPGWPRLPGQPLVEHDPLAETGSVAAVPHQ